MEKKKKSSRTFTKNGLLKIFLASLKSKLINNYDPEDVF